MGSCCSGLLAHFMLFWVSLLGSNTTVKTVVFLLKLHGVVLACSIGTEIGAEQTALTQVSLEENWQPTFLTSDSPTWHIFCCLTPLMPFNRVLIFPYRYCCLYPWIIRVSWCSSEQHVLKVPTLVCVSVPFVPWVLSLQSGSVPVPRAGVVVRRPPGPALPFFYLPCSAAQALVHRDRGVQTCWCDPSAESDFLNHPSLE